MKTIRCILFVLIAAMILPACGHNTSKKEGSGSSRAEKMMKLKKYTYIDQQGTGIEGFSFLMPDGWEFTGGMKWILDNPAMPAVTAFRVFNPAGKEEFEAFPNHCFFWTNNMGLLALNPPGSRYFGNVVKKPVTALEALRSIILPEQRGVYEGLTIVKEEDLPELPEAVGAGQSVASGGATGAKIRVNYVINGQPMEEEFYGVVELLTFPVQGMFGTTYNTVWYVDFVFSFKSEQGKLESYTKPFQIITSTFKLNPAWYAKYSNVIVYMAQQQIQRIRNIGEFSRMLSRMSDQMSSEQLQQFESRGSAYDKVSQTFSDNMLGIDRFYDPYEGREVELPSGYNHAWSNNLGEYIVTDNPNFNPNIGSNLGWQELKRK